MLSDEPSLYGLNKENSSRTGDQLWGKNEFNSTFPLSLLLFIRDHHAEIKPVSVMIKGGEIKSSDNEFSMRDVVGECSDSAFYNFEEIFDPYRRFFRCGNPEKIDLIVSVDKKDWRALEIKLTVVPDSKTSKKSKKYWSPEIVMRPVSSAYAMMGVASSLRCDKHKNIKKQVIKSLERAYNVVGAAAFDFEDAEKWEKECQILKHQKVLQEALRSAVDKLEAVQKPFLVQPMWHTQKQSFLLSNPCLDVFVWSDAAILSLPARIWKGTNRSPKGMRWLREIARHVRAMYEVLTVGNFDYSGVYCKMGLGEQTDKSFAMSGHLTRNYLQHERLSKPLFYRDILDKIILNDGYNKLKPERRFDASLVFYHMLKQNDEEQ